MIDVLYVAWNRLEFTQPSFKSLLENTDWSLVNRLIVHDDGSTDGTAEHLVRACSDMTTVDIEFDSHRLGGPVAVMNQYLARSDRTEFFAKVDNDFVMPPGWLNVLSAVLHDSPKLDIIGTEPFVGLDAEPEVATGTIGGYDLHNNTEHEYLVGYTTASHIGGKGLIRTACFDDRGMRADGRQGFTQWQHQHEDVTKAWITPDIKSFGLDQLPFDPWISLTRRYVHEGWQREWPKYSHASHDYWDWWLNGEG